MKSMFALVMAGAALCAACPAAQSAEGGAAPRAGASGETSATPKKKISPEKLRATIRRVQERKTGGVVRKAGSAKGEFVVIDAQNAVPADALAPILEVIDNLIRVRAKIVRADAKAAAPRNAKAAIAKAGGVLGVVLSDGAGDATSGSTLLVAPEDGWAVVDVSALAKDGPDAATLAARVRKEALRAFAFVAGGAYVARGEPLMRDVLTAKDLDAVGFERFGIEEISHLRGSTVRYGLVPWHQTTYLEACREGWAPAPTNEFQRAIWEKVKADKERGPTNPITIPPPSAKK